MELTENQSRVLGVLSTNAALYRSGMDWTTPKAIAEKIPTMETSGVVRCLQGLRDRKLVEETETRMPPREGLQKKPRRVWRITRKGRRLLLLKHRAEVLRRKAYRL